MHELIPIYILITLVILCLAGAVVIKIKGEKGALEKGKPDFIDRIVQKKQRSLNQKAGGFQLKTYLILFFVSPVFVTAFIYLLTTNLTISMVLGLLGFAVPECLIRFMAKKQQRLFDERYARALRTLASCLRSNMTIQQAVDETCKNVFIHESIRAGFRQISTDLQVGLSVREAFGRFADATGSTDARDVTAAIAMQNEVGGNEAYVISSISQNITDRIMARKEIKALFADTNVMIWVMDIMPPLIAVGLYFAAPQYILPYFSSPLMTLLFIGLFAVTVIGSVIIRRMAKSAKEGA